MRDTPCRTLRGEPLGKFTPVVSLQRCKPKGSICLRPRNHLGTGPAVHPPHRRGVRPPGVDVDERVGRQTVIPGRAIEHGIELHQRSGPLYQGLGRILMPLLPAGILAAAGTLEDPLHTRQTHHNPFLMKPPVELLSCFLVFQTKRSVSQQYLL